MKRFLPLLCALLLVPLCAFAVTSVPAGVDQVDAEAFANTDIDALIIPASVQSVGANILSGCDASYIYLEGASTALDSGANGGVPFVFAPAASAASSLSGFYASENLTEDSGLYYYADTSAQPLCAQAPSSLSGSVTVPKLLGGLPVTTVDHLYLTNTGVTEVRVPAYLGDVSGMNTVHYETMFLTEPEADNTSIAAGEGITWTTSVDGAYGDVIYTWTVSIGEETNTATTTEPAVTYYPAIGGTCTVTVTAQDSLGDKAEASGGAVTVTSSAPVYRALLVGNSYPGESCALDGPLNDLEAMRIMLGSMSGTDYSITATRNRTAEGIKAAIASTFASATSNDVSLFYFSGHGAEDGSLIGTGSTSLTVYGLRSALQNIPGTKVVLLDCCYSGTSINRSVSSPASFNQAVISALSSAARSSVNLEDAGYIVITACSQNEKSMSLSSDMVYYWGAFTYGLCYGSGYDMWQKVSLGSLPADSNGDGAITLGEAYAGVKERISYLNELTNDLVTQSTQYYGDTSFVLWVK